MLLGKIMAEAAMRENKFVTWLPAYGAEVRGGTAYCVLVISDKEIGSPCVDKADILVIMNAPSLVKFKERVNKSGMLIINSSLVKKNTETRAQVLKYPFTDIASAVGNIKVANVVALGLLIAKTKLFKMKTISKVITSIAPAAKRDLIEINKIALEEGRRLG